jgi:hypothetical protein
MAQITYEDEDHITIIVPSSKGEEFAKIINKDTINTIEIIYAQMLETPKDTKGDVSYG